MTGIERRVARRIDDFRTARGLSQEELGTALGLTQTAVSRRFTYRHPFTLAECEAAAQLFAVPVEALVALEEPAVLVPQA